MPDNDKNNNIYTPTTARSLRREHLVYGESHKIFLKHYRTEIAASCASLASTLLAYPLDSMKTRMQSFYFQNFISCVKYCYKREGIHGFWRGVSAPLASITLVRTLSFSAYQRAKYTYDDWIFQATGHSPIEHANTVGALPSLGTVLCFGAAGATSGALVTAIACPFELVRALSNIEFMMDKAKEGAKTGAQTATHARLPPPPLDAPLVTKKSVGTLGILKLIYKSRGMPGLWTGYPYHLLRDTIGTGMYFMTYESSKQLLANARGNSPTTPLAVVIAGGLCGIVSWACIYPIDSAKSIYQRNALSSKTGRAARVPINFFDRNNYRGLVVSMVRSCCTNAIFFSAFEFVKKQINRVELRDEGVE